MDDYEKYERDCEKIRKANGKLLGEFAISLQASGLAKKTIKNHISNIDFYINQYLLNEDATEARDGAHRVDMFLGYWFIKKAMWASPASIRSNAASLKKFYGFLHQKGLIDKEELDELKSDIKEGMPEWLEEVEGYGSSSGDDFW